MSKMHVTPGLAFEFLNDDDDEVDLLIAFDITPDKANVKLGSGEPFPTQLRTPSLTTRPPRFTRRLSRARRVFNRFGLLGM